MAAFDPNEIPAWTDWITNFDQAAVAFANAYQNFLSLSPQVPQELQSEYNSVLSQANEANNTIQYWANVRSDLVTWLSNIGDATVIAGQYGGLSGIGCSPLARAPRVALSGYAGRGRRNLGIAPVIIYVAAATAAVAFIVYVLQQMETESQKVALLNSGHSVADVNALLGTAAPSITGTISTAFNSVLVVALIVGAVFLLPRLNKGN